MSKQGDLRSARGVALYARTASTRPEDQGRSATQVAALQQRIQDDGLTVVPENCFVDEGCSGNNLLRPGLQRLRERAAAGEVEWLYIYSPDRLSRRYGDYLKLVDELRQSGVTVTALQGPWGSLRDQAALPSPQVVIVSQQEEPGYENSW